MSVISNKPFKTLEQATLADMVAHHPFLQDIKAGPLRHLTEVAMLCDFKKDEVLFQEGEVANRFYLILNGKVAVEACAPDREPRLIQHVCGGDVLGWSWLFAPFYWNFGARAVEDTSAIFFYGKRLREQSEVHPVLGYELMKRMAYVVIQRLQSTRLRLLECQKG